MNALIKFSEPAFRRGVNDVLSLSPLRKAVTDISRQHMKNTKKAQATPAKGEVVANVKKTSRRPK